MTTTQVVTDEPARVQVTCQSPDAGTFSQTLVITTNDPDPAEATLSYPVTCTVSGAEVTATPVPGSTLTINTVQGTAGQVGFTLQNTGNTELAVLPQTLPAPFGIADGNGNPFVNSQVPVGATSQYFATCNSASTGTFNTTLTIATNDANENPVAYTLVCNVAAAPGVYSSDPPPGTQIVVNTTAGATGPGSTRISITAGGAGQLEVDFSGLTPPLSISPAIILSGNVPPGNTRFYDIECLSADAGIFNQTLTVTTNDPTQPTVTYPVQCVAAGPEASATPATGSPLAILTPVGQSGSTVVTFQNTGTTPLTYSTGTPAPPWGVSPQAGTIPAGGTQNVSLTCNSTTPGTFNTTYTFTTNDFNEPTFTYPVECVVGSPDIATTPAPGSTIALTAPAFTSTTGSILVSNAGQLPLDIALGGLSGTLSATPVAATIPAGGSQSIVVSCASAPPTPVSQTLTIETNDPDEGALDYVVTCTGTVTGERSIQIVSGDGQSAPAGSQIAEPLIVRLIDPTANSGFGAGVPVLFSIVTGDAVFARTGQIDEFATTGADGTTGVQIVLGNTGGPLVVTAGADGFGQVTFELEIVSNEAPVRSLTVLSGNNQQATPNTDGEQLVAVLRSGGQPVAGEPITWTVTSGSGITLSARSSVTNSEGLAGIGIRFGDVPTAGTIEARDSTGLVTRFTVLPAATVARFRIVSGDAQTGGRQTLADEPIVFELADTNGPVAGAQVSFAITEGTATLSSETVTTDAQGLAPVRLRYGNQVGRVAVTATAISGSVRGTGFATVFEVVLGKAAGDNQTGPVATRLPIPLTIQISRPPGAKGLAGAPVTWTVVAGGGTLTNAQGVTDATGRATAELTLGPQPGNNQVRAAITGLGEAVFNATATPSTPGNIQILTGNNQTLATNETSGPLTVRLVDQAGQPVANARIRWTASDDVQLSADETRTDANGNASVTALLLQPGGGTVTATAIDAPNGPTASFTLNGGIAETEGANESEQNVARALDEACPILAARADAGLSLTPAQQDLLARCIELIAGAGEIPGETRSALEELIAEEATAQNNAALIVQASQFDNLKARIAALRSGTQGASFSGLALQTSDGSLPLSFLPSAILGEAAEEGGTSNEVGADFSRWGFFATGTVGQGDRDGDEDSADTDPGFAFDTYGLTAGVDYRYSDRLVFGAALGYNQNDTDLDGDDGSLDATGYSLSGYATWYQGDAFYVDSVLTFGSNDYDLSRSIRYSIANPGGGTTNVDQVATASPGSDQTSFAVSVGKDWAKGAWAIGPYLRGLYTRVDFDGYEETLSDPNAPGAGLGVTVEGREIKSMQAVLGGKISYTRSMSWGILIPNAQVEYLHEFEDDPDAVITRFVNDPSGTPIEIETAEVDTGYFNLGFGLSAVFAQGRSAFVYFEHRAGQDRVSYDNLAVGVRIEF